MPPVTNPTNPDNIIPYFFKIQMRWIAHVIATSPFPDSIKSALARRFCELFRESAVPISQPAFTREMAMDFMQLAVQDPTTYDYPPKPHFNRDQVETVADLLRTSKTALDAATRAKLAPIFADCLLADGTPASRNADVSAFIHRVTTEPSTRARRVTAYTSEIEAIRMSPEVQKLAAERIKRMAPLVERRKRLYEKRMARIARKKAEALDKLR